MKNSILLILVFCPFLGIAQSFIMKNKDIVIMYDIVEYESDSILIKINIKNKSNKILGFLDTTSTKCNTIHTSRMSFGLLADTSTSQNRITFPGKTFIDIGTSIHSIDTWVSYQFVKKGEIYEFSKIIPKTNSNGVFNFDICYIHKYDARKWRIENYYMTYSEYSSIRNCISFESIVSW